MQCLLNFQIYSFTLFCILHDCFLNLFFFLRLHIIDLSLKVHSLLHEQDIQQLLQLQQLVLVPGHPLPSPAQFLLPQAQQGQQGGFGFHWS